MLRNNTFFAFFSLLSLCSIQLLSQEISYTVRNLSNEPVQVATAQLKYESPTSPNWSPIESGCSKAQVSKGWLLIGPNKSRRFTSKKSLGLCLRIETKSGTESIPVDAKEFQSFPTTQDRFQVCNTINPKVIRFLNGFGSYVPGNEKEPWYKNVVNTNKGSLPNGWKNSRFFVVSKALESMTFDVLPSQNTKPPNLTHEQSSTKTLLDLGPQNIELLDSRAEPCNELRTADQCFRLQESLAPRSNIALSTSPRVFTVKTQNLDNSCGKRLVVCSDQSNPQGWVKVQDYSYATGCTNFQGKILVNTNGCDSGKKFTVCKNESIPAGWVKIQDTAYANGCPKSQGMIIYNAN